MRNSSKSEQRHAAHPFLTFKGIICERRNHFEDTMTLSRQSLKFFLDLIDMKVSALQIQDRDDARELNRLRKCRQELLLEINHTHQRPDRLLNTLPKISMEVNLK
jgi:hypothetical protein